MKTPRTVISSDSFNLFPNLKELFTYKDLFFTLIWRDFKVRYAQTFLGIFWAIIQPILTISILYLVFGKFLKIPTQVPTLLYITVGMSMWGYFSFVLNQSGNSLINQQDLIKKVYFPRLIIPISKSVVGLIDYFIYILIMFILLFYYQIPLSNRLIFFPLFIIMGGMAALSVGIWVSALTVRYRDIQQLIPFVVQLGLYITPIAYPINFAIKHLPTWAVYLYYLNPVTGAIQGLRWILFNEELPVLAIGISCSWIIILLFSGLIYFQKAQRTMADVI